MNAKETKKEKEYHDVWYWYHSRHISTFHSYLKCTKWKTFPRQSSSEQQQQLSVVRFTFHLSRRDKRRYICLCDILVYVGNVEWMVGRGKKEDKEKAEEMEV